MGMPTKIEFYLRFYTRPGQSISVVGNLAELGMDNAEKAFELGYLDKDYWRGSLSVSEPIQAPLRYQYILKEEDGRMTHEWGDDRLVDLSREDAEEIQLLDTWNYPGEFENVFFTSPYRDVLLPRGKDGKDAKHNPERPGKRGKARKGRAQGPASRRISLRSKRRC
jgi:4-alpha-glucanotransferase